MMLVLLVWFRKCASVFLYENSHCNLVLGRSVILEGTSVLFHLFRKWWKRVEYLQWASAIKKQRHYFVNKGLSSQGYGFSCGHVQMWELDYKESCVPKNWCFWTVVLGKTLESLRQQGDQTSQSLQKLIWIFIRWTDVEAEAPILWPSDVKKRFIKKDPCAGKDWRQEEKGMTEDEMV